MRGRLRVTVPILAAAAAALLFGCASPQVRPGDPPDPPRLVRMQVAPDGSSSCRIDVAGRRFALPAEEETLLAFLRTLAAPERELVLRGGMNTPYRCIGGAIYAGQRAGFTRVGFLSEPARDRRRR